MRPLLPLALFLALAAAERADPPTCHPSPKWTIDGEDIMGELHGQVILIATMEVHCKHCKSQITSMKSMAEVLVKGGMHGTEILIIAPRNESQGWVDYWSKALNAHDIRVFRESEEEPVWNILRARNHDFFIYDRCGRLAYLIPDPQSYLYYHYTVSSLHNTHFKGPCGRCAYDPIAPSNIPSPVSVNEWMNRPRRPLTPSSVPLPHVRPSGNSPGQTLWPSTAAPGYVYTTSPYYPAHTTPPYYKPRTEPYRPPSTTPYYRQVRTQPYYHTTTPSYRRETTPYRYNYETTPEPYYERRTAAPVAPATRSSEQKAEEYDYEYTFYEPTEPPVEVNTKQNEAQVPPPITAAPLKAEPTQPVYREPMVTRRPRVIDGTLCTKYTDKFCFSEQQAGRPLHPCCYKGMYLTDACQQHMCGEDSQQLCCFQKFVQARYLCCMDEKLEGAKADEFSHCCYKQFVYLDHDDPCCPASVSSKYWNKESTLFELCLPNVDADFTGLVLEATMIDKTPVRLDLAERAKMLDYVCPYVTKRKDFFYYQPPEQKNSTKTYADFDEYVEDYLAKNAYRVKHF